MPSRAETRNVIESALRIVSITLIAWMFWLSLGRDTGERTVTAGSANLHSALEEWSTGGLAPDRIRARLDATPSPVERDWLAALDQSGSSVSWSGSLPAVAIGAQPVASPRGGSTVVVAGPARSSLRVQDEVGPLDTAESRAGGASFVVPAATGAFSVRLNGSLAKTAVPEPVSVRRVLVIGNAGWEAKFVVAALEEDGWNVDASMHVAPGVNVTQGTTAPIDTARYSAVVALDASAASRGAEISRYVASGGGIVLAGSAAAVEAFGLVRAGAPGRVYAPAMSESDGPVTLASLSFMPLASLKPDGIALERRGSVAVAGVRRHVAGRVLQQGYVETWRWRMNGGDKSVDEHRALWTRAVASVAYVPGVTHSPADSLDAAPVARLVEAIGPATTGSGASLASAASSVSLWWLFGILTFCLLAEWLSRRTRGLR